MAKQTITTTAYTDDLDGSKAEGTTAFSFEGTDYEIDLSKSNTRAFEKAMSIYVGHARKVRATRRPARGRSTQQRDLGAIREWANANGYDVSSRGRISAAVVAAYDAR